MAEPLNAVLAHYRARKGDESPLATCMTMLEGKAPPCVCDAFQAMTPEWRDYVIACVYALLMPGDERKHYGTYFTPPHLVAHLLSRMSRLGVDFGEHGFHDPAAGGAAFIVPLARRMTSIWRQACVRRKTIIERLLRRLAGREIDRSLAELANALIRCMLVREHGFSEEMVRGLELIGTGDSLSSSRAVLRGSHEIGNPPYRRLSAAEHAEAVLRFGDIASGRMNLYAMFVRAGLDNVPVGGIVAHVVPASFMGGPEFRAFRQRILELADVEVIDLIEARENVFLDVQQDACFIVLRRRDTTVETRVRATSTGVFHADGSLETKLDVDLPLDGSPWSLPGDASVPGSTLLELGYRVRVGYLVANRQRHLLHAAAGPQRFPLIWAKAICTDGRLDHARGASAKGAGWANVPGMAGVVREPCVVVQRTSSRGQQKRVYAAPVTSAFMDQFGGFIAENHVLILIPNRSDAVSPENLAVFLNSMPVDDAVNKACGSASISAKLLSTLSLPPIDGAEVLLVSKGRLDAVEEGTPCPTTADRSMMSAEPASAGLKAPGRRALSCRNPTLATHSQVVTVDSWISINGL